MTRTSSPIRLAHDRNAPSVLRDMVRQAQQSVPAPASILALTSRVVAATVQPAPPCPSVEDSPASALQPLNQAVGLSPKLTATLAVVLGLGVTGAIAFWSSTRDYDSPRHLTKTATMARPALVEQQPGQQPRIPEAKARSAPAESTVKPLQTKAAPRRRSESELLESARRLLKSEPQRALLLTEEHARLYPKGALSQEREVIAIEALSRLGKREDAKARGADFGDAYPDSAHQPRLYQSLKP